MPDYEVTDPHGIEYRPEGGGRPARAKTGETVGDLTGSAADWLLRVGAIVPLSVQAQANPALSREALNVIARDAGVPDPEGLPNKDAVVEAIETAEGAKTNA